MPRAVREVTAFVEETIEEDEVAYFSVELGVLNWAS